MSNKIAKELEQTVLKDFVKPFVKESFDANNSPDNTSEKIPTPIAWVLILFSIAALIVLLVVIPFISYRHIENQQIIFVYTLYFLYYAFVLAMFTRPLYLYIKLLLIYIFS